MLDTRLNGTGGHGAQRAVGERSEVAPGSGRGLDTPDPELIERPKRRRFTAEYKLRILQAADACSRPGEIGALRSRIRPPRRTCARAGDRVCGEPRTFRARRARAAR